MRLFLDSSVVLAACGRPTGAARFLFSAAAPHGWHLYASDYVVSEVAANVARLGPTAVQTWTTLHPALALVPDVLSIPWPVVFDVPKDRPVLFTATACADVLLTLDRRDFHALLGRRFYDLSILTPGDFLMSERASGRLRL